MLSDRMDIILVVKQVILQGLWSSKKFSGGQIGLSIRSMVGWKWPNRNFLKWIIIQLNAPKNIFKNNETIHKYMLCHINWHFCFDLPLYLFVIYSLCIKSTIHLFSHLFIHFSIYLFISMFIFWFWQSQSFIVQSHTASMAKKCMNS